ncbi:MAG TPA: mucoidy inhibitor MuiA family protein [Bacteroidia bacterium]|nr:mucoidy inhibitor MuiA family protein [Bacteroidia bacterium]
MKSLTTSIIATAFITLFASNHSYGAIASSEKNIKSKIENVTVFTQGAQIHRSSLVNMNSGITTLIFEGLESTIDARSIQASGFGNFVIMDVQHSIKYPEPKEIDLTKNPKNLKQIKMLQDSLVMIDFDIEEITSKMAALNIEKNTLLNNRIIKGETKKDTLNLVKDALTFLREKLSNINSELLKLKKEEYRVNVKKQRMQTDLLALQTYNVNTGDIVKDETNYRVIITVSADVATNGTMNINYMLQDAGWSPSYDLRAKAAGGNMQLTYKAQVYQNTGIDWNDVKLTLSTASPNQSNVKPVLNTWWLNYYNPYAYDYKKNKRSENQKDDASKITLSENGAGSYAWSAPEVAAQSISDYVVAEENITTVEYDIKLAYSIPCDGKTHFVAVQTKEIPAHYIHFAAPKMDKDAFLVAKITDWDELNLAAGSANIYFDGTFVGESYIDPTNLSDTLDLTLGRDKNMVVTRVKQKDKTKEKLIGEDKVKTVTYEITIRNTKSSSSNFNLQDQIPVSQTKDIVVTLAEASGGELDEASGIVNWKFNLKAKETKKVTISYTVKFPKDKALAGL